MVSSSMWAQLLVAASLLGTPAVAAPEGLYSAADIKNGIALAALQAKALANVYTRMNAAKSTSCNVSNVKIRREWRTLSSTQKKSFIDAMKCVRAKPSLFAAGEVPGSKSLYDDFIAVHLNQTMFIHLSGSFLTWHRHYVQTFENELNACGYVGSTPYWEWGLDVLDVTKSPIFDGSALSLGGDGEYIPHEGMQMIQPIPPTIISTPPGTGGGCVTTGPFGNLTIRLGPVSLPNYGDTGTTSVADPLGDNLRCLKRDLNTAVVARYSNFYNSSSLVLNSADVGTFQGAMQGDPRYLTGELGVHGGGHFTIGGDPGSDPFVSPGDPAFWLHHSQVDRLYWIWQNQDWDNRQTVFGGISFLDLIVPGVNTTLDSPIDLSPITESILTKDVMSTTTGAPLCYVYL